MRIAAAVVVLSLITVSPALGEDADRYEQLMDTVEDMLPHAAGDEAAKEILQAYRAELRALVRASRAKDGTQITRGKRTLRKLHTRWKAEVHTRWERRTRRTGDTLDVDAVRVRKGPRGTSVRKSKTQVKSTATGRTWTREVHGRDAKGRTFEGNASGDRTRNADGTKSIHREGERTKGEKTVTWESDKTVKTNADGSRSWESSRTKTGTKGTSTSTAQGTAKKTANGKQVDVQRQGTKANGVSWSSNSSKKSQKTATGKTWTRTAAGSNSKGKTWTAQAKGERRKVGNGKTKSRVDRKRTVTQPGGKQRVNTSKTHATRKVERSQSGKAVTKSKTTKSKTTKSKTAKAKTAKGKKAKPKVKKAKPKVKKAKPKVKKAKPKVKKAKKAKVKA